MELRTGFKSNPLVVLTIAAVVLVAAIVLVSNTLPSADQSTYRFDPSNPQPPPPGEPLDPTQQREIETYVWQELEAIRAKYGYHSGGVETFAEIMDLYSYEPFLRLGTNVRMQINSGAGNRLRRLGGERFAAIFYERGLQGALATRPLDTLSVYLFATETGHSAYRLKRYDEALKKYTEIYSYAKDWNQLYAASALNNIGLAYLKMGKRDSAQAYFERALVGLDRLPEPERGVWYDDLAYAITDNLGLIEWESGHYDAALRYFESNINAVDTTADDGYFLHRHAQAL